MLNLFRYWRERGWTEIDATSYAAAWQRFGGSFVTHPRVVERLSGLAEIPVRYLGWLDGGHVQAAIPCWDGHLALAKTVLKQRRRHGLFDLGNAEVILPIATGFRVPVRVRMRYLSAINVQEIDGARQQAESLAMARAPENYSPKFRYNQRRELRLFEEAGGSIHPLSEFQPSEQAAIYCDLFARRWGFPARGKAHLCEVLTLLREFVTGSLLLRHGQPVAMQLLYRAEAPGWVSLEYVNGGVDPQHQPLSPGSVLSFVNTQAAWSAARAIGKPLRYSFGRADREYKDRWCHRVPVFEI
ncbi:MAG TPA: GNAT family N-acetyltransferase [Accumulibacter sp.]|jgi:hypothetical protein|nr:GNAT family N-acetyltransferase [Accumulibacter sp.]HQC79044.1 GNAT family N-acetyltransferase [Accumulibacter sp.]